MRGQENTSGPSHGALPPHGGTPPVIQRRAIIRLAVTVAILVTVAVLAFLRTGSVHPLAVLFLLGSLAWMSIRILFEAQYQRAANVGGRLESALMFGVFFGMALVPFAHIAFGLLSFADYSLPAGVIWGLALLGLITLALGIYCFIRSHRDLGHQWSPTLELQTDHKLIDTGIYGRVRNPMYLALFLIAGAQWLFLHNWIAGPAGLVSFAALYALRIKREEAMMAKAFGAEWDAYKARTPRLIPKLAVWAPPSASQSSSGGRDAD